MSNIKLNTSSQCVLFFDRGVTGINYRCTNWSDSHSLISDASLKNSKIMFSNSKGVLKIMPKIRTALKQKRECGKYTSIN